MNQPPKPIACIKCNSINFRPGNCVGCGEALSIVDKAAAPPPTEQEEMTQEEAKEILADEIAAEVTGQQQKPEVEKLPGAKKPTTPVDRELARRKLRAKLNDAKMNRAPLSKVTEVRDSKGRLVRGARRVPTTETRPMSTPASPFEVM